MLTTAFSSIRRCVRPTYYARPGARYFSSDISSGFILVLTIDFLLSCAVLCVHVCMCICVYCIYIYTHIYLIYV